MDFHKIGRRFDCFLLPGIEAEFREQYLPWYWKSRLINKDYLRNKMNTVYILSVKNHINCTGKEVEKMGNLLPHQNRGSQKRCLKRGVAPVFFRLRKSLSN